MVLGAAGRRAWASRVGSHGTFPATSVARAASFDVGCSASDVATTIGPIPRDTMSLRDTVPLWDTTRQRMYLSLYSAAVGYCVAWDIVPLWVAVSCEAAGYRGSERLCCPSSDAALVAECLRVRPASRGAVLAAAVTAATMRSIRRSPQRPRGSTSSAPLARQGRPRASECNVRHAPGTPRRVRAVPERAV